MNLLFWRKPVPIPVDRYIPLTVKGNDGKYYRLKEPADIDRMTFSLSDEGQRSATARLWRRAHQVS